MKSGTENTRFSAPLLSGTEFTVPAVYRFRGPCVQYSTDSYGNVCYVRSINEMQWKSISSQVSLVGSITA